MQLEKKETPVQAKTILVLCLALIVVFLITRKLLFLQISLIMGIISLLSEDIALAIHRGWTMFGNLLGKIVPKILLSIIFFAVLVPIAFLARIFTKEDPLMLHNKSKSTFIKQEKIFGKETFINPW